MKISDFNALMEEQSTDRLERKGQPHIKIRELKGCKKVFVNGHWYYISKFEVIWNFVTKIVLILGVLFFIWVGLRLIFGF